MTTWNEIRAEISPEVDDYDAQLIIEEVSGYSRAQLVTNNDESVPELAEIRIREMVKQRLTGEPIQYVLGSWSFRKIVVMVDNRVLIPRPETEMVVEYALETLQGKDAPIVIDLCTGSGAIACSVASEVEEATVWATEISQDAATVARANVSSLGILGRNIRIEQGHLYDPIPEGLKGSVDLIVSNPPYIGQNDEVEYQVEAFEPHIALYADEDGLRFYPEIFEKAIEYLKPDGFVVVEIAPPQSEPVKQIASSSGFDAEVLLDLAGRERAVRARLRG